MTTLPLQQSSSAPTTAKRHTKFTVINYGAADALLAQRSKDDDDDEEADSLYRGGPVVVSKSPPSTGIVQVPVKSSTRKKAAVVDANQHVVAPTATGSGGTRLQPPVTVRQVSVDSSGRVQVSTPRSPTYVPRLAPPFVRRQATSVASTVPAATSLSSIDVMVPSRTSLVCCWSSDVSAAERGGAGEVVFSSSSEDTSGYRLKSPVTKAYGEDRLSGWPNSGQPLMVNPTPALTDVPGPPVADEEKLPLASNSCTVNLDDDTCTTLVDDASEEVSMSKLKDVAKRGRLFAKRCKRRLVYQSGECNLSFTNVERRGALFLLDIFTTLLEMKWRYRLANRFAEATF